MEWSPQGLVLGNAASMTTCQSTQRKAPTERLSSSRRRRTAPFHSCGSPKILANEQRQRATFSLGYTVGKVHVICPPLHLAWTGCGLGSDTELPDPHPTAGLICHSKGKGETWGDGGLGVM